MSSMPFLSPLRYPGGKAKVANFVQTLVRANSLLDGHYVEPYVGGGSVALSLLFDEFVKDIYINDKDISVYAFWYSVLNESKALIQLIRDTPVDVETRERLRCIQEHKDCVDLLELGFSTFYLNRTNRSGILKAGVIGGKNQTGNFKIDARFNKEELISRIQRIALYADRIHLFNEDAVQFIGKMSDDLDSNTLFYLDPPYYVKGKGLYLNYYSDSDHREIAEVIKPIKGHRWIISYDNVPFIRELYSSFRHMTFQLNYSASNSGKGEEIMIFGDNVEVPEHPLFNPELQ